jgi:glycosyltransferase involved in cell wall biosynthesis
MDADGRPLKILELGMHFDPSAGGADRYFDGLLQGLQSLGTEFEAAAFGPVEGKGRISLGPRESGLPQRLKAIWKLGSQLRPGGVVATHFALYALPLLPRLGASAHVVHFHGPWAGESAQEGQKAPAVAAKRWVERSVYKSARKLIVLSGAFRDILVRDYGVPAERIAVIPGGVDVGRFRPAAGRQECRSRLGWPQGGKIIFCVRRMVRRMGLENLVEAFGRIAASHPDAMLALGGRGPLLEDLRRQASALGLGDRILFCGFIPEENLPMAYAAADFSIVPSQALEGFGLITLESLACGTPVLVTPVGGLPETVRDLDPTLVLADSSTDSLAEGLRRGLSGTLPSPEVCRDYAVANFSWPAIAGRVLQVYREAVE